MLDARTVSVSHWLRLPLARVVIHMLVPLLFFSCYRNRRRRPAVSSSTVDSRSAMGAHPTAVRWCAVAGGQRSERGPPGDQSRPHPRARPQPRVGHGVLPKIYRNNPKAFPMLEPADTVQASSDWCRAG